MSWFITLLQTCILIVLSYLAVQFFTHNVLNDVQLQLDDFSLRLAEVESTITRLGTGSKVHPTNHHSQSKNQSPTVPIQQTKILAERLQALELQEQQLEKKVEILVDREQVVQGALSEQLKPQVTRGWLSRLSEDKRIRVQNIFHERLASMQNAIGTSPDEIPSSSEDIRDILSNSRQELKDQLGEILTEEEYSAFLETLENGQYPPGVPFLESQ